MINLKFCVVDSCRSHMLRFLYNFKLHFYANYLTIYFSRVFWLELYSRFINSNFKFNQHTSCIIKRREQRSDKLQTQQHQILTFMNKIMKIHYFDRKFDCSTVTTMLNFPRLVFRRLSTNLSNTIVYCLRVTFDDCFFNFFFFSSQLGPR